MVVAKKSHRILRFLWRVFVLITAATGMSSAPVERLLHFHISAPGARIFPARGAHGLAAVALVIPSCQTCKPAAVYLRAATEGGKEGPEPGLLTCSRPVG